MDSKFENDSRFPEDYSSFPENDSKLLFQGCRFFRVYFSRLNPQVPTSRYVVPTGRVIVPAGRYIVPTDSVIVATGRYIVPAAINGFEKSLLKAVCFWTSQFLDSQNGHYPW
nr:hypothetical protein [Tanacetum cinerariifolium]